VEEYVTSISSFRNETHAVGRKWMRVVRLFPQEPTLEQHTLDVYSRLQPHPSAFPQPVSARTEEFVRAVTMELAVAFVGILHGTWGDFNEVDVIAAFGAMDVVRRVAAYLVFHPEIDPGSAGSSGIIRERWPKYVPRAAFALHRKLWSARSDTYDADSETYASVDLRVGRGATGPASAVARKVEWDLLHLLDFDVSRPTAAQFFRLVIRSSGRNRIFFDTPNGHILVLLAVCLYVSLAASPLASSGMSQCDMVVASLVAATASSLRERGGLLAVASVIDVPEWRSSDGVSKRLCDVAVTESIIQVLFDVGLMAKTLSDQASHVRTVFMMM